MTLFRFLAKKKHGTAGPLLSMHKRVCEITGHGGERLQNPEHSPRSSKNSINDGVLHILGLLDEDVLLKKKKKVSNL